MKTFTSENVALVFIVMYKEKCTYGEAVKLIDAAILENQYIKGEIKHPI